MPITGFLADRMIPKLPAFHVVCKDTRFSGKHKDLRAVRCGGVAGITMFRNIALIRIFAIPGKYGFVPQDFTLLSIHANQMTHKLICAAVAADAVAATACDKDVIGTR